MEIVRTTGGIAAIADFLHLAVYTAPQLVESEEFPTALGPTLRKGCDASLWAHQLLHVTARGCSDARHLRIRECRSPDGSVEPFADFSDVAALPRMDTGMRMLPASVAAAEMDPDHYAAPGLPTDCRA